jgi:aspartyl-tRNA(Asn)/glutamyl-tRNA(Gln) amidotransferase subunit A
MSALDPLRLTALEARRLLIEGEVSAAELTKIYLDQIDRVEGDVHAYILVAADDAAKYATKIDREMGAQRGALAGLPTAIKDNMVTEGTVTTCASKILAGYQPIYTASAVRKLFDDHVVMLGKTNLDEFAMGSSTENSSVGTSRNPWDLGTVPGGSSGGSAAAVAAGEALWALGSDIGRDPRDSTSVALPSPIELPTAASLEGLRFGIPREYLGSGVEKGVRDRFDETIAQIEALGGRCSETSLPHTEYALPAYYIIAPAEASANLARFDGVRYGYRAAADDLIEMYERTRGEGFGPEVKRRIMIGTYALSSGYYDAYYGQAQKVRTLVSRDFATAFAQFDLLISPTSPTVAFPIGSRTADPLAMYMSDICTIPVNLAGLPAISIPCGLADGLPVGFQLMGPAFSENLVLRAAHALEGAIGFDTAPMFRAAAKETRA